VYITVILFGYSTGILSGEVRPHLVLSGFFVLVSSFVVIFW